MNGQIKGADAIQMKMQTLYGAGYEQFSIEIVAYPC